MWSWDIQKKYRQKVPQNENPKKKKPPSSTIKPTYSLLNKDITRLFQELSTIVHTKQVTTPTGGRSKGTTSAVVNNSLTNLFYTTFIYSHHGNSPRTNQNILMVLLGIIESLVFSIFHRDIETDMTNGNDLSFFVYNKTLRPKNENYDNLIINGTI